MDSQHYQLDARIPEGATPADLPVMMQNFLAQRFHLVVRRETKDLPIYAIVIAKSVSKLQETVVDEPAATPPSNSGAPKLDAYGFPASPASLNPAP